MAEFSNWTPQMLYDEEEIARRIGAEDERIPFLARSSTADSLDFILEDHFAKKPGEFMSDNYRSMLEQERTLGTYLERPEGEI